MFSVHVLKFFLVFVNVCMDTHNDCKTHLNVQTLIFKIHYVVICKSFWTKLEVCGIQTQYVVVIVKNYHNIVLPLNVFIKSMHFHVTLYSC